WVSGKQKAKQRQEMKDERLERDDEDQAAQEKKHRSEPGMKPERLRNRILAADLVWIPVALAAEQALCSGLHCNQLPLGPSNFVVHVVGTVFAWVLLSENLHLDGFRGG